MVCHRVGGARRTTSRYCLLVFLTKPGHYCLLVFLTKPARYCLLVFLTKPARYCLLVLLTKPARYCLLVSASAKACLFLPPLPAGPPRMVRTRTPSATSH